MDHNCEFEFLTTHDITSCFKKLYNKILLKKTIEVEGDLK
ncbi:hypothetical protein CHCC19466_0519 [Bacillus licheniformis]|nr:hypothetical protein CHCC19466_0519 [Bacillus licheniformis]